MTWPENDRRLGLAGALALAALYLVLPSVQVGVTGPASWGVWLTWGQGPAPTVAHVAGSGGAYSVGVMLRGYRRQACDFAASTDGRSVWVQYPRGERDLAVKKFP